MSGLDSKYGGRKCTGRVPITDSIAALAESSSAKTAARSSWRSSGCVWVWFATSWPSAMQRRSVASLPSIASPQTKNVARAPLPARRSRICSVQTDGPSSNVSATSGAPRSRRWITV